MRKRSTAPVVTDAPMSPDDELRLRQRHYAWAMGIRTVGTAVAMVVPLPLWMRLVLILGCLVVPFFAVVGANQPHKRVHGQRVAWEPAPDVEQPRLDHARVIDGSVEQP